MLCVRVLCGPGSEEVCTADYQGIVTNFVAAFPFILGRPGLQTKRVQAELPEHIC